MTTEDELTAYPEFTNHSSHKQHPGQDIPPFGLIVLLHLSFCIDLKSTSVKFFVPTV